MPGIPGLALGSLQGDMRCSEPHPVTLDPEAKVGLCNLIPRAGHFQSRSSKLHAGWEVTMSYGQCLVVSDSLQRQGLQPARPLCPWDCPGKKTGVGCHFLLQGIFPTQGSNPGLPHCRRILYRLGQPGKPSRRLDLYLAVLYLSFSTQYVQSRRVGCSELTRAGTCIPPTLGAWTL